MINTKLYKIERNLLLASFALVGFKNYFMGFAMPMEYSTFLVFMVLFLQIISGTFRFPKFLFYTLFIIFLQTFLVNMINLWDTRIWHYYIGLVLFALSIFSFISYYKSKIVDFVISYYKFAYYISLFSIIQVVLFLVLNISIIPQILITGIGIAGGSKIFIPEILMIFPRSLGLSSEPANFAYIIIPGVYLALSKLLTNQSINGHPKHYPWIILIAMLLTFSLVAYIGILLCVLFILKEKIFKMSFGIIYRIFILLAVIYGIYYVSDVGKKLISLVNMGVEVSENRLETNSYTAFALISNGVVTLNSQKENHYIGSGMNTHFYNYEKYIYQIFSSEQVLGELNAQGGGSLFIRILSEFGIPGLFAFFVFLIHYRIKNTKWLQNYGKINEMALVTILLFCLRSDDYVSNTFLMFVIIYYFTYRLSKTQISEFTNKEMDSNALPFTK